jgi:cell division protein FtsB
MTEKKQIAGSHYLKDIQPWDAMKAWWGEFAFAQYCMMTSIKYIMRDKHDKVEDLQKAIHYLEAAIHTLKESKND